MSSRFGLKTDANFLPGLVAVGLFVLLAAVSLAAPFGDATGFTGDGSVMASIGYAMFNIDAGAYDSDGFLVAFIVIAFVLDAALDGAILLAKREGGALAGVLELSTDGGSDRARTDGGRDASSRSGRSAEEES